MERTKFELVRRKLKWTGQEEPEYVIEPKNEVDAVIFEHCTKGSVSLMESYYKKGEFIQIFRLHGLEPVITDED